MLRAAAQTFYSLFGFCKQPSLFKSIFGMHPIGDLGIELRIDQHLAVTRSENQFIK